MVILALGPHAWFGVSTNQWGWSLNSEFATLGALMPSSLRGEMNDTVTELVSWHFSGSQPPMAGQGAELMGP